MPEFQRPIYLSGKVVLDDGTPTSDQVVVQLVCRALPRSIAYVDSKGNFSADLNNRLNSALFADASSPYGANDSMGGAGSNGPFSNTRSGGVGGGGITERDLMGCDLQAYLPGYRSDVIHLGARHAMENPEIGTIVLHRLANVEGLTISATSRLAPKDAQKAMEKARNNIKKQKWDDAQKELEKAVSIYPKYAAAWYELGNAQREHKDLEGARKSYAQSLESDPKFVSPYLQLAILAARDQKWDEVADDTDRLLHLNPVDFPQAYLYNALANYYLKKMDAAEKSARDGISHDDTHRFPKMNHLLGVILAQKQDYAGSAENLRSYLKYAPTATDADTVKKQLAEVEKSLEPEAKKQ
jgi:tetratricopeptide (TPR) repeat protein